jgi:hypothetical protein
MTLMMENLHFAKGIDPIADAFAATVRSDVYSMRGHGRGLFVIYAGVGATGTSTITINACDDVVPTTRTAIAFWYREITSGDTQGAITRATSTGFVTTAGSSKIILVEVDAKDLAAVTASDRGFVELTAIESVDSPVLGGVMFIAGGRPNRYARSVSATVIV